LIQAGATRNAGTTCIPIRIDFEPLSTVQGRGTSQEINHYQTQDRQPLSGINYYRLAQVDFDGSTNIQEKVVAVKFEDGPSVAVIPNPVRTEIVSINYLTEQVDNWKFHEYIVLKLFKVIA